MIHTIIKLCSSCTLLGILVFLSSCVPSPAGPEDDNPLHESGSNYTPPEITYINISDGDRITVRNVLIKWNGNTVTTKYSYQIDSKAWEITTDTSVTLQDLDEGSHTFRIEPQNDFYSGEKVLLTFTVNAVQGQGIYFSPRKIIGITNTLLYLKDIHNLMGAHIEITASQSCAELSGFTVDNALADKVHVFADDSESSRLIIDLAYLGGNEGLSGTFLIGSFTVRPVESGMITIDLGKTVFRDINNNDVIIRGWDTVRIYE